MTYEPKPPEWFIERIGKWVLRDDNQCDCAICDDARANGLLVVDDIHAKWLSLMDGVYAQNKIYLNYRDKPIVKKKDKSK